MIMKNTRSNGFRYETSKKWFKGNTHLHSTASDDGLEFIEPKKPYAGAGIITPPAGPDFHDIRLETEKSIFAHHLCSLYGWLEEAGGSVRLTVRK